MPLEEVSRSTSHRHSEAICPFRTQSSGIRIRKESMSLPSPKPSNTSTFTSPAPSPADAGTLQTGGWANNLTSPPWWNVANEVLEALPANVRVQLSGITKIGPNQYSTTLSLSGTNTLQLVPNAADAKQNSTTAVTPNSFTWAYTSRNIHVATVNSSGLVTAVGRGECEISVRSFRQVNASFTNATPSGTEGVDATIQVTVLP